MPSYEHDQIRQALNRLSQPPDTDDEYRRWIEAREYLELLSQNAVAGEVILLLSTTDVVSNTRVYSAYANCVLVDENDVSPPDHGDLLHWRFQPMASRADYAYAHGNSGPQVKYIFDDRRPTISLDAQRLVFGREKHGIDDDEPIYYEILQEFIHAANIHWRQDQRAFCRIDENGNVEHVLSITNAAGGGRTTLITCQREPLELFLAVQGKALVRFFELMIVRSNVCTSWDEAAPDRMIQSPDLCYKQQVHPDGHGRTRGAQILRCLTPKGNLFKTVIDPFPDRTKRQYANFIIEDRRNGVTATVSTDPRDTTNYFQARDNDLPYEVSAAFFRPEVLSKYKSDRDKYTVDEPGRTIFCRGTWSLKSYGVNEAGQVHAYICDLRGLPYQEQLHWQSHNEPPKGTISKRAHENDILGEWASEETPLERLIFRIEDWNQSDRDWWNNPSEDALLRVNTPIAANRDEWAEAFLELTKVAVEPFRLTALRSVLDERGIHYDQQDRSLGLLEKLLAPARRANGKPMRLAGLREAQSIRTKVHAHSSGSEAAEFSRSALLQHGSYRAHFESVCALIADELEEIAVVLA